MLTAIRRILPILAITLFCAISRAADSDASASYTWKSVKVGAGGFIPGIVFSPVERGLAYLRSDMGGAYRWDNRQQTWVPLEDQLAESSYFGVESIAPDPVDPNVVYMAAGMYRTEQAAILRSNNKGKTWQVYPVSFHMGGNDDGRGLGERLAIDPNDTQILYFGSRNDGLMRSSNSGKTWNKVASFHLSGLGEPGRGPAHGGLSFVLFDTRSSKRGSASKVIYGASADSGPQHLFRSIDAGETWQAVPGEPDSSLLPVKGEMDAAGVLYITYCNGIGPNGVTKGAVMKLDTGSGNWTDISPDKRPDRPNGGYMGISIDRMHPGTLGVTTMNRWGPVDTVWRTIDGGNTWSDIVGKSIRDVSATPYLKWGQKEAKLGWWMAAFAIDPFDSNFAVYATGATVYATRNFSAVTGNQNTVWFPWVKGIEQTAIITLISPGAGPHLISGFGDIGGFVHDDLSKSPPQGMFMNPQFNNTDSLACASMQPNIIVRSGRPANGQAPLGYTENSGVTWHPIQMQAAGRGSAPAILLSADGKTIMSAGRMPQITRDRGQTWLPVRGLPAGARPVADCVNSARFYALDFTAGTTVSSSDGGATFSPIGTVGLPTDLSRDRPGRGGGGSELATVPGKEGDLWFVSREGLYHSTDGGKRFEPVASNIQVEMLSFGKSMSGKSYPAMYSIGRRGDLRAIWRSVDQGASWVRINDDQHQYGTRFRCIAADPRVFGRVYVGTDGRGIVYGEPASKSQ